MPRHTIIAAATVAATALVAAPVNSQAAKNEKVTTLACTLQLYAHAAPGIPSGIHFGLARCPAPFGDGVHFNEYTVTPTGPGTGSVAVSFKNFYARGTTHGTAAMTFTATAPGAITYTGTVTYTGGTGKFKHLRGTGTIHCTTTDGGAHKTCSVSSQLTGI